MNALVRLYLKSQYEKQQCRELQKVATELREIQVITAPLIKARNKAEMYKRRQGDGFVILDYGWVRP